jgi:protease IV
MNKLFKILIFIGFLWILSYGISYLMVEDTTLTSSDQIAIIPIQGMITLDGSSSLLSSTTSGSNIVEKIESANENDNVKAIILEINSPGGTVMGSKVVADAIKNTNKPVVAYISEYGTSGAYWIASQSDLIISDELSIVGSISVVGSYLEFSGLLDDYNITYQRLVTGQYKDIGNPYKELTSAEEAQIQERLDSIHNFFITEVAEGRDMTSSEIEELSDGLFYLGLDAVNNGLVDELGSKDYAINRTKSLANLTNVNLEEYTEETSFFDSLKEFTASASFYMGQGMGTTLFTSESSNDFQINL